MTLEAHVVGTTAIPAAVDWLAAAVMVAGTVGTIACRGRELRSAALVAAVLGATTTVTLWIVAGSAPASPGYRLSVAAPVRDAAVTSPVTLRLCGTDTAGRRAAVPGGDRLVSVSVDGAQTVERPAATMALTLSPGQHRLHIEVLSVDHRQFAPPLAADVSISVTGTGALAARGDACSAS